MAHVLLTAVGSHGDVHPFVGLGRELLARGHRVTLVAFAPFGHLAERHGFGFHPIGTVADYDAATSNPDLWHPKKSLQVLFGSETYPAMLRDTHAFLHNACKAGGAVLVGSTLAVAARLAHDTTGAPLATVHLQPLALSSVQDPPILTGAPMPRWAPRWWVRFVYWAGARQVVDPLLKPAVNAVRAEYGLPPLKGVWHAWRNSPQCVLALFPEWFAAAPDWPANTHTCGFVRYDGGGAGELPAAVAEFLNDGPPPVVVSFGSAMRTGGPHFAAAAAGIHRAGARGLILAKGGDQIPKSLPPGVRHADWAPFSQVFPRAAVVIHHGGIGTTAQALAAGVPQLVMPLAFDQPDNAARLRKLGVAAVIEPRHFTPAAVAAAIGGAAVRSGRCEAIAAMMKSADGVAAACQRIEALAARGTATGAGTTARTP